MIILLSFLSLLCSVKGGDINYNTVVKFSKGEQLKFPDFKLEFTGTRDEKKEFPNGNSLNFRFYDFTVSNDKTQKISVGHQVPVILPRRILNLMA